MKSCEGSGKDVRVYFCPSCKSRNVRYVFGLGNLFGVLPKMRCGDCEYSSQVFPVLVVNQNELKKATKKKTIKKKAVKKKVVKKAVRKKVSGGKKK